MRLAIILVGVLCGACAPVETKLAKPDAELLQRCPALPLPPRNDGNPQVRGRYYGELADKYGRCADRHNGLATWAERAAKS